MQSLDTEQCCGGTEKDSYSGDDKMKIESERLVMIRGIRHEWQLYMYPVSSKERL